jgi:hypothetical protein
MEDGDLKQFLAKYADLAQQARQRAGEVDTGSPDVECEVRDLKASGQGKK